MQADIGKRVKVQFVGRLEDGRIFSQSDEEKPLEFTLGKDNLIPGFVEAVRGMETGESKTVVIPPEKGFGEYDSKKLVCFSRQRLAAKEPISAGMEMSVQDTGGNEHVGRVDSVNEESITLDLNHPLAGQGLKFDIRIQEVV